MNFPAQYSPHIFLGATLLQGLQRLYMLEEKAKESLSQSALMCFSQLGWALGVWGPLWRGPPMERSSRTLSRSASHVWLLHSYPLA